MSARPTTIPISEVFLAVQGEGPLAGVATVFVRTGGCDSRCSWCDSLYAVLPKYKDTWQRLEPQGVVGQVVALSMPPCWVTLSGGNPAIHSALGEVIRELHFKGYRVAVETQGTVVPAWHDQVDRMVVSPKPPSSGEPWDACRLDTVKTLLAQPGSALKIVIADREDWSWALRVWDEVRAPELYVQPCNPQGADGKAPTALEMAQQYRDLAERVLGLPPKRRDRVRVLPQLHVLAYGSERGR